MDCNELRKRTRFNSGTWIIENDYGIMNHRECIELSLAGKVLAGVNVGSQKWV